MSDLKPWKIRHTFTFDFLDDLKIHLEETLSDTITYGKIVDWPREKVQELLDDHEAKTK